MENGTSLDDILNSEPAVETAPEPETIGQPRDESGRFAPREQGEEQQPEPIEATPDAPDAPPASEQEPSHIPMAALKDERTKRQQIEAERQQLAERLQQYEAYFQQLQAPQTDEEPDPVDAFAAQIEQKIMSQVQHHQLTDKVNMTEVFARQKWADYDEKVELFKEEAKKNPYLVQQLMQAPNPAEYAYQVSEQIAVARNYGGAQPSREQLEAEIRQKIMAEIGMSPKVQAPTSLASERSVGSRGGPAWSGPTALGDILG
jgi:hypothetical protein